MITNKQLKYILRQTLHDDITTLQPIGVSYGSNWVYGMTTATGQRYVVKQPKQIRESMSPFWQQMDAIFGVNSAIQLATVRGVSERLQQQTIIPVPQVIHVERNAPDLEAPFVILTHLAGTAHEPDEFPPGEALHYQLGQFIGYLHAQPDIGFGNVLMKPLRPQADFLPMMIAAMRQTIQRFWADCPQLHQYLDNLAATIDSNASFSSASLIMTDISGNQFVYDGQRISGVVDLDAYVIGPREWELSTLEMGINAPAAFRQGYECYRPLPTFAPFRAFYRFWMYLNEPGDGYDAERLTHFMQQTIHFA
jgi:aminoglycoside phosphotransferase (APT) family kinase protein